MTLEPQEFMRRFLLHVLPPGFHRIRHYGLLANGNRRDCLALARAALHASAAEVQATEPTVRPPALICRHCGRPLLIVEIFTRAAIDSSAAGKGLAAMTARHLSS